MQPEKVILDALSIVVSFLSRVKSLHWHIIWVGVAATIENHVPNFLMRPLLDWLPLRHQPDIIFRCDIDHTVPVWSFKAASASASSDWVASTRFAKGPAHAGKSNKQWQKAAALGARK